MTNVRAMRVEVKIAREKIDKAHKRVEELARELESRIVSYVNEILDSKGHRRIVLRPADSKYPSYRHSGHRACEESPIGWCIYRPEGDPEADLLVCLCCGVREGAGKSAWEHIDGAALEDSR